jgi:hypothetical protein
MMLEVNIRIGLIKGLRESVARAGCKMRQCRSSSADDKPLGRFKMKIVLHRRDHCERVYTGRRLWKVKRRF